MRYYDRLSALLFLVLFLAQVLKYGFDSNALALLALASYAIRLGWFA